MLMSDLLADGQHIKESPEYRQMLMMLSAIKQSCPESRIEDLKLTVKVTPSRDGLGMMFGFAVASSGYKR